MVVIPQQTSLGGTTMDGLEHAVRWEGDWIRLNKFDHDLTLGRNSGIIVSRQL